MCDIAYSNSTTKILEDQLQDDLLLRMWRTGACTELLKPEEDDDVDVCYFAHFHSICFDFIFLFMQLSALLVEKGEYGLNIDTDVALWLDSREFENKPTLRQTCGFVIVNSKLHDEFDHFKERNMEYDYSLLPYIELIDLWINCHHPPSESLVFLEKFKRRYIRLHNREVDSLCRWVLELRVKFYHYGQEAFTTMSSVILSPGNTEIIHGEGNYTATTRQYVPKNEMAPQNGTSEMPSCNSSQRGQKRQLSSTENTVSCKRFKQFENGSSESPEVISSDESSEDGDEGSGRKLEISG